MLMIWENKSLGFDNDIAVVVRLYFSGVLRLHAKAQRGKE